MVALPAVLLFSTQLFGAAEDTVYQIHTFQNVTAGGVQFINMTNSGASLNMPFVPLYAAGTAEPAAAPQTEYGTGYICVNAYVFDPQEELTECCSCNLSPNSLWSWDVFNDLDSNNLNGLPQTSLTVKLIVTYSPGAGTATAPACNPATAGQPENISGLTTASSIIAGGIYNTALAPGLIAFEHTLGQADSAFQDATLSMSSQTGVIGAPAPLSELARNTTLCGFNTQNGTGTGVCKGCTLGGR